ncbi:PAS domain S-box-containing protein [Paraburkholderia steynii]|uniref:Virulence sensor protein BvgS n=1 Tax=Paraburkholderia steynii TaxID=1245441 RepID=A0A7Z7BJU8_9BURK|nr:response regulator [Paraburkholderia steynii]SDJ29366.1 PAS domain S-box-containing protein [Paraburkholderia steynii]
MASRVFSRISLPIRVTLFLVVVCALLIGSDVWRSVTSRQDQMEEMSVAAANLARAMAQHADDTIKQADTTLVGVVERVEHDGVNPVALDRLHRLFMQSVAELPQLNGLYLYDRDGKWLANSQPTLVTTFNNADREYFIYHRTHADRGPHIGMPVKSRSTGKWIVPVSRRIDGPDGQFAGVALATIDIEFFTRFYDSLDIGRYGAVALVADNGIMVVRRPFETRFIGKNVVDTMLFKVHRQSGEAGRFVSKSAQDGVTRLNSVRNLSQYPLFVAAALAQDEILAPWWSDTLWHAAGTTVLVLMLAVFGWRLVRNANARTRIERKLAASLETTRGILDTAVNPIITLDRSGVILTLNPAGEKAFGYAEREIAGKDVRVLVSATVNELFTRYASQFAENVDKDAREIASECELAGLRKDGSEFPIHVSTGTMVTGGERRFVCVITDMSEQIRERAELSEARDQLLLAADIAELGIWSWEFASDALRWNTRMFEIFGYTSTPTEGLRFEHWLSRVHEEDRAAAVEKLEAAFAGEITAKHIHLPLYRIVLPDGEIRHIQTTFTVQRDVSGKPVGMTGVNHDVTEPRNIELRLRDAKQQADAANEAKSAFLANMSHEIRTPLNAVLGMLDLVQSTGLNERQGGYVVKAETAAKSLLGLLNDILDYSKIEAGKLQLDTHTFEIEPLMQDLGVVLSGNQYDKEVEVLFDISPDLPPVVIGDSLRLQQVLVNLAGNALKFTIKGQVVVSFTLLSRLDSGVRVRIAVTDSGIGISETQLTQIFEGFSQAEVSTTRRFGGTGLGLAISRRLVELMGGKLEVASELGKGSRFWFDINLGVSDVVPVDHFDLYQPRDRRLRVLVADDNGIAREVLSRTARALGWEADVVPGGISAVKLTSAAERENEGYDVILLDWRMPDLDGLAAARRIDEARAGRSTPAIVMITAYGQEVLAAAQESDDMPFDAFVTKPVTPKQLAQTVQRVLTGQKATHAKRKATPAPEGAGRLAGLTLLVVEDNPLNREVAEGLLSREGAQVALAESGLEGVEKVLTGTRVFDAVLMDMQMPDVDGLEATRLIRSHERFASLPIIAMTANATRADRDACLAAGMNDHVGKPIDVAQLVNALLAHTRASAAPESTANSRADDKPAVSELLERKESIVGRFGGSEDLIRKALGVFVSEMERHLDDLRDEAEQGGTGRSAALLHAIKGSAGTMGAKALADTAAALEHRVIEADDADEGQAAASVSHVDVDSLERLLLESVARLRVVFGSKQSAHAADAAQLQTDEYRERLGRLLERLESSNLEALDLAETLAPHVPSALQPRFDRLLAEIEALDFVTAAASTREMLDNLTC